VPFENRLKTNWSFIQKGIAAMEIVTKDYWEKSTPWAYQQEKLSYAERRKMRFDLQDYMAEAVNFSLFAGKKVLEIGCGAGIDSAEFARNGALVTAVDFTDNAISLTKKTFAEAGLSATVLKSDARNLDFPNGTFDVAYSFGVLHHIPEIDDVLTEIVRVLKDEGEGIFMVYNKDSLLNAYSILYLHRDEGLSEKELASKYSERNVGNPYTKLFTKKDAEDLFGQYFKGVIVDTYYNVIDTSNQRKVKISAPKDLGWHHIIHCKDPLH
jgi:ubiquinone/menaquinone biosynthesis C-methylase UbiE